MKRLAVLITLIATVLGVGTARAAPVTVDFESYATSAVDTEIYAGDLYEGLYWDNIYVLNAHSSDLPPGSNYPGAATSGDFVAHGGPGVAAVTGPQAFTFEGAWFTSAFSDSLALTLTGWRDGILVAEQTIFLGAEALPFTFDAFVGIDRLEFLYAGGDVDRFAMDDFTYAPVPEPGTLALLGSGLAGLAGAARRRRRP